MRIIPYTITDEDTFENIYKNDHVLINHVVIPSGKMFPKHPTDAEVCIIILRGELSVAIDGQEAGRYAPGGLVNIPKGAESELGNTGGAPVEIFVVKSGF